MFLDGYDSVALSFIYEGGPVDIYRSHRLNLNG